MNPHYPSNLGATIYSTLGIDPQTMIADRLKRRKKAGGDGPLRGTDGKFRKTSSLKLTGTSRVTVLTPQEHANKVVLAQREVEAKDLVPGQAIAVITLSAARTDRCCCRQMLTRYPRSEHLPQPGVATTTSPFRHRHFGDRSIARKGAGVRSETWPFNRLPPARPEGPSLSRAG